MRSRWATGGLRPCNTLTAAETWPSTAQACANESLGITEWGSGEREGGKGQRREKY